MCILYFNNALLNKWSFLQFKSLLSTVEAFDKHSVNQKFLKYKPSVSLSSSSKSRREWWKYAISAVREEDVKRRLQMWSWTHIKQHRWVGLDGISECCHLIVFKFVIALRLF